MISLNKAAQALGRKGGESKSERKRKASAENGKKGGYPRKDRKLCSVPDVNSTYQKPASLFPE